MTTNSCRRSSDSVVNIDCRGHRNGRLWPTNDEPANASCGLFGLCGICPVICSIFVAICSIFAANSCAFSNSIGFGCDDRDDEPAETPYRGRFGRSSSWTQNDSSGLILSALGVWSSSWWSEMRCVYVVNCLSMNSLNYVNFASPNDGSTSTHFDGGFGGSCRPPMSSVSFAPGSSNRSDARSASWSAAALRCSCCSARAPPADFSPAAVALLPSWTAAVPASSVRSASAVCRPERTARSEAGPTVRP